MTHAWIIRAGRNDDYETIAFEHNLVSVGWWATGDLTSRTSQQDIKDVVRATYPEVEPRSADGYAIQLYAFRSRMEPGDLVLLLRRTSPDVAVGWVDGPYRYRADLGQTMRHVRPVQWVKTDLPRSVVAAELLNLPALAMIFRINQPDTAERLRRLVGSATPPDPADIAAGPAATAKGNGSLVNLQRNLNYARNLATAGEHLAKLDVRAFEIEDVFRAAWVQAVAALDHWVRQEIRERLLRLARRPDVAKPDRFSAFPMTLGLLQEVQQGSITLADAIDRQLRETRPVVYQDLEKIREGFGLVADVKGLWVRVAKVLSEQAGDGTAISNKDIERQFREIVQRRHKIAHEYDEDPQNPPAKRAIDAATTTQTIDWIEQLAGAIVATLNQE